MIQRIQSVFLALAAVCGGLTFLFPVAVYERADGAYRFGTMGLTGPDGTEVVDASLRIPFGILIGVCAAVYLAVIFLYRNRPRQVRVAGAVNLLLMALVVFLFITDRSLQSFLGQGGGVEVSYGASLVLPVVMMVLGFLAVRGIRKDEALVRSTERLR